MEEEEEEEEGEVGEEGKEGELAPTKHFFPCAHLPDIFILIVVGGQELEGFFSRCLQANVPHTFYFNLRLPPKMCAP